MRIDSTACTGSYRYIVQCIGSSRLYLFTYACTARLATINHTQETRLFRLSCARSAPRAREVMMSALVRRGLGRALTRAVPAVAQPMIPPIACRSATPLSLSWNKRFQQTAAPTIAPPVGDALLIKVSGQDSPGITATFTELLASTGCDFYDIDQPWCQPWCTNNLSLYFLVGMPTSIEHEANFIRQVLDKSKRAGLNIEFEVVSREDLQTAAAQLAVPQGLVVTLLKPTLGFKEIAAVARTATQSGFNISKIKRLSTLQQGSGAPLAVPSRCTPGVSVDNVPNISAVEVATGAVELGTCSRSFLCFIARP